MRFIQSQTVLLSLFLGLVASHPYPRESLQDDGYAYLTRRDYTTTWTVTYTSTISSFLGASTAVAGGGSWEPCKPVEGTGQIACGPICCANWQYCASEGQCLANNGGSWTQWTTVGTLVTTQYSQPYRVTGPGSTVETPAPTTTTGTVASETTSSTAAPAPVASTSGSLSGGAIAGIVVGTIAGVVLLLLLCFCCIVRGLWDVFAGIFGFGKKRRKMETVEITEERYSRHGSRYGSAMGAGAAGRASHRTWFGGGGGGGGRPTSAASRKEKKSGGNVGWLAAGLGAAALLLGLRRSDKRRSESQRPPRSDWSSAYYTDSYSRSSPSSMSSSDRRTRDTRRSRRSAHSRGTRASRPSRTSRPSRRS